MKPPSKAVALFSLTACAIFLTLGSRCYDNADAVVPVLCSRVHWTPTYWGQSRFGMLLPTLAAPVTNYWLNYLTQGALSSLALFGAFAGAASWLGFSGSPLMLAGCSSLVLILTCSSESVYYLASLSQPYGVSLALLGCFWSGRASYPRLSLILLGLAFWVNYSLIPLQLALALVKRQRSVLVASIVFALLISFLNRLNPAFISEEYRLIWPSTNALQELAGSFGAQSGGLLGCSAVATACVFFSKQGRGSLQAILLAGIHFILASGSAWVSGNNFHFRYLTVCIALLSLAVAVPLSRLFVRREHFLWLILPLLFGLKFPGPTLQALDPWAEQPISYFEMRQMRVTVLAGNYFDIYPMAFREWSEGRPLYPLVHRGEVLRSTWEPLLKGGEAVAVEPSRWNELEFFLIRVCKLSLGAGQWQTVARTQHLVVARWKSEHLPNLPIQRAPLWSDRKDWRDYLGYGWELNESDLSVRFTGEAELIINAPRAMRVHLTMNCNRPVSVTTNFQRFSSLGSFSLELPAGAQLIKLRADGSQHATLSGIAEEEFPAKTPKQR